LEAGKEALGVFFPGLGDNRVGQVQDGLGGAVVFFQLDDFGAREQARKVHDVAEIGAPEGIDGLAIVAHGHDVFMGEGQQTHQFGLKVVGILIFVHHDVAVAGGQALADVFVFGEQAAAFQEQVVVIHEAEAALFLVVGDGHAFDVMDLFQKLGVVPGHHRFQGQVLIDRGPQDVGQGFLAGEGAGNTF
jgi:hypothetical protein